MDSVDVLCSAVVTTPAGKLIERIEANTRKQVGALLKKLLKDGKITSDQARDISLDFIVVLTSQNQNEFLRIINELVDVDKRSSKMPAASASEQAQESALFDQPIPPPRPKGTPPPAPPPNLFE